MNPAGSGFTLATLILALFRKRRPGEADVGDKTRGPSDGARLYHRKAAEFWRLH